MLYGGSFIRRWRFLWKNQQTKQINAIGLKTTERNYYCKNFNILKLSHPIQGAAENVHRYTCITICTKGNCIAIKWSNAVDTATYKNNNNPLTCTICCPLVSLTTSSVRAEQTAEHKTTHLRGLRQTIISIQGKQHKLHKGKLIEPRKSRYVTAYQGSIDTFYDVRLVYSFQHRFQL